MRTWSRSESAEEGMAGEPPRYGGGEDSQGNEAERMRPPRGQPHTGHPRVCSLRPHQRCPALTLHGVTIMRKIAAFWTCGRSFRVWRIRERNFYSGKCRMHHHRSALRKPRPRRLAKSSRCGMSSVSDSVSLLEDTLGWVRSQCDHRRPREVGLLALVVVHEARPVTSAPKFSPTPARGTLDCSPHAIVIIISLGQSAAHYDDSSFLRLNPLMKDHRP